MELLVWHDALGSDDEQATDEERAARLLYALNAASDVSTPDEDDDSTRQGRGMHALQFMEALVAFTRLLRRPRSTATAPPQWISVALKTRRFFVQEVEPRVFFALGIKTADLAGQHLRSVHAAILQEIYDLFRLFHGPVDRRLRQVPQAFTSLFDDGMAMLQHIGATRRRLRKISIALELGVDVSTQTELQDEQTQLQQELTTLLASSPSRSLWSHCDALFPTLLNVMEVRRMNLFHELDGVAYFPMDETTFLAMQTLVNSVVAELAGVIAGGIALFYKGSVIWRTIDAQTLSLLERFLRLREQDGMDITSPPTQPRETDGGQWMPRKYDDAFSPIWASKTSYAECAVVRHVASQPRRSSRSLHKQTPTSLNTLLNELMETAGDAPVTAEQRRIRRSHRYRSDAPVYRNRGFLTTSGYFLPSWELAKPDSDDCAWTPTVILSPHDNGDSPASTALFYHENDLSLLILLKPSATHAARLQHMERVEDCLEKHQFTTMATTIWKNYLGMMGTSSNRDKTTSTSQPPYIYLNRVNSAFKVSDATPRLLKSKETDLYPRPASLWGHYFPTAALALLNDAHASLQDDSTTIELCVKTVHDGWLIARRAPASSRELYALLDTKAASVAEAQDATLELLATEFSNIYR